MHGLRGVDVRLAYSDNDDPMIFDKPPLFNVKDKNEENEVVICPMCQRGQYCDAVKVNRKSSSVSIEGKWSNIKNLVRDFEAQGWTQKEPYPEVSEYNGERLTQVELVQC